MKTRQAPSCPASSTTCSRSPNWRITGPEDLFLAVITIIGAFIALCFVNPLLTVILFVCIPFIVLFAVLSRKGMLGAFRKMREEQSEINSEVESAISGMRISRAYTAEAHESEKFERSNVRYRPAAAARTEKWPSSTV